MIRRMVVVGALVVAAATATMSTADAAAPAMGGACTKAQYGSASGALSCVQIGAAKYVWAKVAPASAAAPAASTASIAGDGQFIVGSQIQPGTYQSPGPSAEHDTCYWFKKDATGKDVGGDSGKGPTILVVAATDKIISTSFCKPFAKVG